MDRKNKGLILLGVLVVIFVVSYLYRSKPCPKSSETLIADAKISTVEVDSAFVEWMLTTEGFAVWRKSVLSEQRRSSRDPFQPPFTKPVKSFSRPRTIPLRLEGIVVRNGVRKAIINGKTYSVGDWVSDKKVVEIGSDYIILRSPGGKQVLSLFN